MMALFALVISLISLLISFDIWWRSFRPIVTIAVKTHKADAKAICYDLVVLNSGTIPAKNIRIRAAESSLASAFGGDATAENKERWLACFNEGIPFLHNGARISCSFGTTQVNDTGFWKNNATIAVEITYESWPLGSLLESWIGSFKENQNIHVADTNSFTGYYWEPLAK
jgi:hypothetical protein